MRTCESFLAMPASERKATITRLQYCVNCLAFNHTESKCRSSHTCFTCGERHHSLHHVSKPSTSIQRVVAHVTAPSRITHAGAYNSQSEIIASSHVLLATAIVKVLDVSGNSHSLRALIDQGSEANFITESALNALQLSRTKIQAVISGIGASNSQAKHATSLMLQSSHDSTFKITVEALVMGRITNPLPSSSFQTQRWNHIIDLALADPSYHRSGRIDLVLGAEVLAQIIMNGVRLGPIGTPIAQQTRFAWILSGKISDEPLRSITVTAMHASSNIEALMERQPPL